MINHYQPLESTMKNTMNFARHLACRSSRLETASPPCETRSNPSNAPRRRLETTANETDVFRKP